MIHKQSSLFATNTVRAEPQIVAPKKAVRDPANDAQIIEADRLAVAWLKAAEAYALKIGGKHKEDLRDWVPEDTVMACRAWVAIPPPKAPIKSFVFQAVFNRNVKIHEKYARIASLEEMEHCEPGTLTSREHDLSPLSDLEKFVLSQYMDHNAVLPDSWVAPLHDLDIESVADARQNLERYAELLAGLGCMELKVQIGLEGYKGSARIFRLTPIDYRSKVSPEVPFIVNGVEQMIDAKDIQPRDGEIDVPVEMDNALKMFPIAKRFEGQVDRVNLFLRFS